MNPKTTPDPFSNFYLKEHAMYHTFREKLREDIDQKVKDLEAEGNYIEADRVKEEGYKIIEQRMIDEMYMNEDMTNWNQMFDKTIKVETDIESLMKGTEGQSKIKIDMEPHLFLEYKRRESEATLIKAAIL